MTATRLIRARHYKSTVRSSNLWFHVYLVPAASLLLAAGTAFGQPPHTSPAWNPVCLLPATTRLSDQPEDQDQSSQIGYQQTEVRGRIASDEDHSGVTFGLRFWFEGYRNTISKTRGPVCNFTPSCSRFSQAAVKRYGMLKGLMMTGDRLLRCHFCIEPGHYGRGTETHGGQITYVDPIEDHSSWNGTPEIKDSTTTP
jgi:putative membrane protein insertion efficiency factor